MKRSARLAFFVAHLLCLIVCLVVLAVAAGLVVSPPTLLGIGAASLALAALLAATDQQEPRTREPHSGLAQRGYTPSHTVLTATPLLLLAIAFAITLSSTRMQLSYHGMFHSAYVYGFLNGRAVPENVTLPGTPANFYWPYHAAVALLSVLARVPPPLTATLLNAVCLASCIALAGYLAGDLKQGSANWPLSTLAVVALFAGNPAGVVAATVAGANVTEPYVAGGDPRLWSLFEKFINFSSFPLAVMLFLAALATSVRLLKRWRTALAWLLALEVLGLLAVHPTTAVFVVAVLPPALILAFAVGRRAADSSPDGRSGETQRPKSSRARRLATALLAAVVLTTGPAVVRWLAAAAEALPRGALLTVPNDYALEIALVVLAPLAPIFLAGTWRGLRARHGPTVLVSAACLLGLGLAAVVTLPEDNEYKFVALATVTGALVVATTLDSWVRRARLRFVSHLFLTLVLANLAWVDVVRWQHPWRADRSFARQGRHVVALEPSKEEFPDAPLGDVFAWTRRTTPPDTVLVVPVNLKDASSLYVLSERLPYVVAASMVSCGLSTLERRISHVRTLYSASATPAQRRGALAAVRAELPGRPLILVMPDSVAARFRGDDPGAGAPLLFRGETATAYAITPP